MAITTAAVNTVGGIAVLAGLHAASAGQHLDRLRAATGWLGVALVGMGVARLLLSARRGVVPTRTAGPGFPSGIRAVLPTLGPNIATLQFAVPFVAAMGEVTAAGATPAGAAASLTLYTAVYTLPLWALIALSAVWPATASALSSRWGPWGRPRRPYRGGLALVVATLTTDSTFDASWSF